MMIDKLREYFRKGFMVNFNFEYTMFVTVCMLSGIIIEIGLLKGIVGVGTMLYFFKKCLDNEYSMLKSVGRFIGFKVCDVLAGTLLQYIVVLVSVSVAWFLMTTVLIFTISILNFTYWSCSYNK